MRRLAVLDLETDPFLFGRIPKPFCAGFYDGLAFRHFWGSDCVTQLTTFLESYPEPLIIYAHNGGKFDFFYFLEHLAGDLRIINNRIIQAQCGAHELRDSYAILPFPLADFAKDEIDYELMEADCRETHRSQIVQYLQTDCESLYTLVTAFSQEFGDRLTIGGAALKELRKQHIFQCGGPAYDEKFRKDFYFGGRNQVFRSGLFTQTCNVYDVNSMYPYVMASYLHPTGTLSELSKKIKPNTCFVVADGKNYGAFPQRTKYGGLDFTVPYGRFHTTIHEWQAAEQTGTFKADRIVKTYGFDRRITFAEFVTKFYDARKVAKSIGDKIHELFYKFVLNSAYGKFAQNPENFFEYQITEFQDILPLPWAVGYLFENKYVIWKRPTERKTYYNVCTGASITGASRAYLLQGLHAAIKPVYCDTDSIICESMRSNGIQLSNSALGGWKLEATGTHAAICGKKLYAIFGAGDCSCETATRKAPCQRHIKKANKGQRLTGLEIEAIAGGATIERSSAVPAFKYSGAHVFTSRKMRRTHLDEQDIGIGFGAGFLRR